RGRPARWRVGRPRLPQSLDRRIVLAGDGTRMVALHARRHLRPRVPDDPRRRLCALQFPDDLLRRFHRGLAAGVALPLLPLERAYPIGSCQAWLYRREWMRASRSPPLQAASVQPHYLDATSGACAMQGKVGLEEHFAIEDTINDSKGFLPDRVWTE